MENPGEERCQSAIKDDWKSGRFNRRNYKLTRTLTIVVVLLVTPVYSFSTSHMYG